MTLDAPVIIAGAGPVGVTLAMDLGRWNVPAIVLERRHEIAPSPRCNTTNARSMELLRRLGCADAVRNAGLPADHSTDIVYMTRLNGHELMRYTRSTAADVRAGTQHGVAAGWPTPEPQHFVSQLYLEPVLRQHAVERWGVDLRCGWELVGFTETAEGVSCEVLEVTTGKKHTLHCRYLVGADGASSMVRRAIDSRLEGISRLGDMCSTFFRSARLAELGKRARGWMLRFFGGNVLVAIDGAERWLLHQPVPADQDPQAWDPEPAMFETIGEPFDYEVIDRSRWTPRAMVATKWRAGSVFLAGDAAHLWVPMGGFGMNAGIADAISLSWRLAGSLQGWAGDALLDTYQEERAPIGGAIAEQAVTWAIRNSVLTMHTPERLAELEQSEAARSTLAEQIRSDMLSEFECPGFQLGYLYADSRAVCRDERTPRPVMGAELYVETTCPGARLPHRWLADGSSLYDQLGLGYTLLRVRGAGATGRALVTEATKRAVPLAVVDLSAEQLGDVFDGLSLILVRPDQHIGWRTNGEPSKGEARRVLDCLTALSLQRQDTGAVR